MIVILRIAVCMVMAVLVIAGPVYSNSQSLTVSVTVAPISFKLGTPTVNNATSAGFELLLPITEGNKYSGFKLSFDTLGSQGLVGSYSGLLRYEARTVNEYIGSDLNGTICASTAPASGAFVNVSEYIQCTSLNNAITGTNTIVYAVALSGGATAVAGTYSDAIHLTIVDLE